LLGGFLNEEVFCFSNVHAAILCLLLLK
jgi:hypothetical protein